MLSKYNTHNLYTMTQCGNNLYLLKSTVAKILLHENSYGYI